jgi:ketosteroid isomerase-like protein
MCPASAGPTSRSTPESRARCSAWDGWELEVEDYLDASDRVVVIINQRGRSKATGIPVEMRFAQVWTLRDGQAIKMQMYASVDEALEAVELSE